MPRSEIRTLASLVGDKPIPRLPAYICDVDGTVALRNGRGPYDFDLAIYDKPNQPVVDLVNMVAEFSHATMIFVTGRKEQFRGITYDWLKERFEFVDLLYMRKNNDTRPDSLVKLELYKEFIEPTFDVQVVFDDRDTVVDMWRSLGLTCMQVAPGAF